MATLPSSVIKIISLAVIVAVGIGVFQFTGLGQYLKPETLRAYIQSFGKVAPAVYVILYCIGPVLFVPGAILSLAGGLAFGALWGTVLTVFGATIGATLAFFVARSLGRGFVERLLKGRFKLLDEAAGRHGLKVILFLRLIPLVPFNALDYAAGLSKISVRDYVLGTFIGIIPGTFAYVYLGSTLVNIYSWQFLSAIALLVLMSLVPFAYKKWKKSNSTAPWVIILGIALGVFGANSLEAESSPETYVEDGSASGLASAGPGRGGHLPAPACRTGRGRQVGGAAAPHGPSLIIDTFSNGPDASGLPKGWKPLHFRKIARHTQYTVEQEGENKFLKAVSQSSASGIYKELDLDLKAYPILSWRWRVENIIQKGDEQSKEGDDYSARLYVTFQYEPDQASLWEKTKYETYRLLYGEYPPAGSLNYIWANKLAKGAAIDSPYTEKSKMVAVESGSDGLGQWRSEQQDVFEDYKRLFGQEPPPLVAIAVMTDTDNTGESATAYYDDIVFTRLNEEDQRRER